MKNVGNNVANIVSRLPVGCEPSPDVEKPNNDFALRVINRVVSELQSIFPAWRHAIPDEEALEALKRTYMTTMRETGVNSLKMIGKGLAKARQSKSDFFPSAGKFCSWCLEDDDWLGAYQRMVSRKKPENMLERMVRNEICFDLRYMTDSEAKKAFQTAYSKWKKIEREGGLPQELPALPSVSVMSDFDKKRNNAGVPDPSKLTGVYKRIAMLGKRGQEATRGNDQ